PDKKATWVNVWALTEIECVRQPNGVHLIIALPEEEVRSDLRIGDLYMTNSKDEGSLFIFCNFAAQLQSSPQLKFSLPVVIESERGHFCGKNKIRVKEERVLI